VFHFKGITLPFQHFPQGSSAIPSASVVRRSIAGAFVAAADDNAVIAEPEPG
jgi:hypothetical protein